MCLCGYLATLGYDKAGLLNLAFDISVLNNTLAVKQTCRLIQKSVDVLLMYRKVCTELCK